MQQDIDISEAPLHQGVQRTGDNFLWDTIVFDERSTRVFRPVGRRVLQSVVHKQNSFLHGFPQQNDFHEVF